MVRSRITPVYSHMGKGYLSIFMHCLPREFQAYAELGQKKPNIPHIQIHEFSYRCWANTRGGATSGGGRANKHVAGGTNTEGTSCPRRPTYTWICSTWEKMATLLDETCATMERSVRERLPPLLTDLYQFTMAYAYWRAGRHNEPAVFELFFRDNPFGGGFSLFAGLSDCLLFLRNFHFRNEG